MPALGGGYGYWMKAVNAVTSVSRGGQGAGAATEGKGQRGNPTNYDRRQIALGSCTAQPSAHFNVRGAVVRQSLHNALDSALWLHVSFHVGWGDRT